MASYKILFLFTLVSFLNFATIQAQEEESSTPVYLFHNCSGGNTTAYSTFQLNLWTLLSSLTSNAVSSTGFYNTTVIEANPSNSVFGLFMCRGDVPPQLCQASCDLVRRVHGSLFEPFILLHCGHQAQGWPVEHCQHLKPGKLHAFIV